MKHLSNMKYFNIFKNTSEKKSETAPDYKISVNIGTKENPQNVEAGGCWLKDMKNGGKYFSCKLSDAYADHVKGVARKGFELVMESSNGNDMPDMPEVSADDSAQPPF